MPPLRLLGLRTSQASNKPYNACHQKTRLSKALHAYGLRGIPCNPLTHRPLSSSFFYGLYLEPHKVIPKRNYLGGPWVTPEIFSEKTRGPVLGDSAGAAQSPPARRRPVPGICRAFIGGLEELGVRKAGERDGIETGADRKGQSLRLLFVRKVLLSGFSTHTRTCLVIGFKGFLLGGVGQASLETSCRLTRGRWFKRLQP